MTIVRSWYRRICILLTAMILIGGVGVEYTDSSISMEKQLSSMSTMPTQILTDAFYQINDIMNADEITSMEYAHNLEVSVEKQVRVIRQLRISLLDAMVSVVSQLRTCLSDPVMVTAPLVAYGRSVIIHYIHQKDGSK